MAPELTELAPATAMASTEDAYSLSRLCSFYVVKIGENISRTGVPSDEFANRLLNEAGVAALPGTAFGEYGEGYLRLSFANSLANIQSALERIEGFVKQL